VFGEQEFSPAPFVNKAYVVGSGPNGLTAAIVLARAGLRVTVLEAQPTVGGGTRSAELTLPGFVHDVCSAVHPLAVSSPAFAELPLRQHGLEWIHPPAALAHPFDDGTCALVERSIAGTAAQFGRDAHIYERIVSPLTARWNELIPDILAPPHFPKHPLLLALFGVLAPWSATFTARALFREPRARAVFAGMAAHSILPLEDAVSAAFGWVLTIAAHAVGWPIPRGGSQSIANALVSHFEKSGGRVVTGSPVDSLDGFESDALILCDVTPRQLLQMAGKKLPESYRSKLEGYRYGPGVFKLDWALDGPIPWKAPDCARAATVHIGGTLEEIAAAERAPWEGKMVERPFVLLAQPSLFDPTRAPAGKHTAWAYCHVPNGSAENMTDRIESQIERFAPGFRARILARHTMGSAEMERRNANLVGGDINGGAQNVGQLFLRPTASFYRTPVPNLFLCSSSTPPGGGVHGMCGWHAAKAALES
jgi:phytoene dehydrogenase-like protein